MDHPKIMVVILLVHYLLLNHDSSRSLICCGFPYQHKGLSQLLPSLFPKWGYTQFSYTPMCLCSNIQELTVRLHDYISAT